MRKQLHDHLDVGNGAVGIWIKKRILYLSDALLRQKLP
ncbi:hypothetical protein [Pectobacterium sp. CHL-2024]